MATVLSLSSLTSSSSSSLSFSSQISQKPRSLCLVRLRMPPRSFALRSTPPTTVVATAAAGGALVSASELEGGTLESYVKSRLPGGFAAQRIWGTGQRKGAIAWVIVQEGTRKVIINYRDAT